MIQVLLMLPLAMTAAWLLWRYAPERKWPLVRFCARAGAAVLHVYVFLLVVSLWDADEWLRARLAAETVPAWAAGPLVWGLWGGWKWLHVGEWISGHRGR